MDITWYAVHCFVIAAVLLSTPAECLKVQVCYVAESPQGEKIFLNEADEAFYRLCECSDKVFYTHHFFIRTFCESKDYNYHMPHKTCG